MSNPDQQPIETIIHPEPNPRIGCLARIGPIGALALLLLVFIGGLVLLQNPSLSPVSTGRLDFKNLQVAPGFMHYEDSGRAWDISYEKAYPSRFMGKVSHVSAIRLKEIPLLTHDILVTSGDFADPALVRTSVTNHHFTWVALSDTYPEGAINLLHTVPKDEGIFNQLQAIRTGDDVEISGWEILRIDALNSDDETYLWWQDAGCNTLLVDSVSIVR